MATTSSTTAENKSNNENSILRKIEVFFNTMAHTNVVKDFIYAIFWTMILGFGSIISVSYLWCRAFYKTLSGLIFPRKPLIKPEGKYIMITGCDTGFGYETAIVLAKEGFNIYAGCLQSESCEKLEAEHKNIKGIQMNICTQEDIDSAVELIAEETKDKGGLYCVINNAGVNFGTIVDWTSENDFRKTMEVNFFGLVKVTKAFFPLLKKTKGRFVNISSLAGLIAGAPAVASYSASKHACEAFCNSFRFEAEQWGVKVININPSFHKTPLVEHLNEQFQGHYDRQPKDVQEEYGPIWFKKFRKMQRIFVLNKMWDPRHVIDTIKEVVVDPEPALRNLVGSDGKFLYMVFNMLPADISHAIVHGTTTGTFRPAAMKENKPIKVGIDDTASKKQQ